MGDLANFMKNLITTKADVPKMTLEEFASLPYHGIAHGWLTKTRGWTYDRSGDIYSKDGVSMKIHDAYEFELKVLMKGENS